METRQAAGAAVDAGARILRAGASGRWAGERLAQAIKEGKPISPQVLRTNDTLRKDEWIHLDEELVAEGMIRLRGVADLIAAGLTIPVPNAMGKTIFQWEDVTDMDPAETTLAGVARTEDDRQEFGLNSIPLPITHKDFNLNLRTLEASRSRGESLDTTQARTAGRLVAERLELMLFQGGPTFGGNAISGYTTHPDRNEMAYGAGGAWAAAGKTGEQMLVDLLNAITVLETDRYYGPYRVYIPSAASQNIERDFKANSDKTIRQRLLEVDRIQAIQVADQMPAGHVVVTQFTRDVVALLDGEAMQSIQWDIEGGFIVKFKAFCIQVPLIRSDAQGRSGVLDMHA